MNGIFRYASQPQKRMGQPPNRTESKNMPSTVIDLLREAGIELTGKVRWGETPKCSMPGIYIVSMSASEHENRCTLDWAPISLDKIKCWIDKVRTFELDGAKQPAPDQITERLSGFWLPDESIVYIGQTTAKLGKRVRQYYKTKLGDKRPHAGGHWIKTLSNLSEMYVYYAACSDPHEKEDALMKIFIDSVSKKTLAILRDPYHPFPFANLEDANGNRKRHGLGKTKLG
jgi:hypothetical protein